jgi:hypothetical protein
MKDEILGFPDLRTKVVTVPHWNKSLTIREMGLHEGIQFAGMMRGASEDKVTLTAQDIARVVAWGVIDPETGERVFTDEDVAPLSRKSQKALLFLYQEIVGLSGDVEEAGKN